MFMSPKKRIRAFTLAETLITLVIIGVVAAITIPSMINNFKETEYKTAYKKAFSDLSNALNDANRENLLVSSESSTDTAANYYNFTQLKSKFKVTKDCDNNNNRGCWDRTGEFIEDVYPTGSAPAFIDNSGRTWSFRLIKTSSDGTTQSHFFFVDTNGFKAPNQFGKDRFILQLKDKNNQLKNVPEKISPYPDYQRSSDRCPSGNCYYTSWLMD